MADADLGIVLNPPIFSLLVRFCFIGIVFSNSIDITRATQNAEGIQLNFQILLKLTLVAASCGLGLWGMLTNLKLKELLNSIPGMLFLGLVFWHVATIPTALKVSVAAASALAFFGIVSLTLTAVAMRGAQKVILDACVGLALYAVASLVLYVVAPEMATFQEYVSPTTTIARLGGLGHPNSLGRSAVVVVLIAFASASTGSVSWKWVLLSLVMCVVVMSSALSRTPILAGLAGLAIIMFPLNRASTYVILVFALLLGLCGWFTADAVFGNGRLVETVLSSTTKTGDVSEVTSLTGRTEIWSYAIKMIAERPFFGWGTGSAAVTFGTLSGHAHNILLQPMVALGLPGGILVSALLVWNLCCLMRYPNAILQAFLAFLFVLGLVESPLLGAFPDAMTPIWVAICFWPIELELWQAEAAMMTAELQPDDAFETIVGTELDASETLAVLPTDDPKTTVELSA